MRFGRKEKGEEERVSESTEKGLALLLGPLWTNRLQQPFPQRLKVTAFFRACIYIQSPERSSQSRFSGVGRGKWTGRGWDGRQETKSSDLRGQINERNCLRG